MRRIHYSGGQLLTGDLLCKAVLRYARALANAGKSDVITIPVLTEEGTRGQAHLLVGPASQIFSTPVSDSIDDPVDSEAIASFERETRKLDPSRPAWPLEMDDIPDLRDYGIEYA
jgi:hypothetical protein